MQIRTELTYAMRTLMRRQCTMATDWVETMTQLQLTPCEIEIAVMLTDIAEHIQQVCSRGWYTAAITVQYLTILEAFVDNTLPYYKAYVFPIYMHANGSFKQSWRIRAVGGIIPLSMRIDDAAVDARNKAIDQQRNADAALSEPITHIFS